MESDIIFNTRNKSKYTEFKHISNGKLGRVYSALCTTYNNKTERVACKFTNSNTETNKMNSIRKEVEHLFEFENY